MGEPEEDEGETEEPEVCTLKQAKFFWVHTWLEEGGAPVLDKDKAQGLGILVLPGFFLSDDFILMFCFLCPGF